MTDVTSQNRAWRIRPAAELTIDLINRAVESHNLNVAAGRGQCLKIDKKRRLTRFSATGFSCVVKEFISRPWHPMVSDRRSWKSAIGLEQRGLPAVKYLAWGRGRGKNSFILMEDLGSRNLSGELALASRENDSCRFFDLLAAAGRLMASLHVAGVYHRDLKTDNFMQVSHDHDPVQLKLIDLDNVRFARQLSLRQIANNFDQFLGTLPPATSLRQALRGVAFYRRAATMSKQKIRRVLSLLQSRQLT